MKRWLVVVAALALLVPGHPRASTNKRLVKILTSTPQTAGPSTNILTSGFYVKGASRVVYLITCSRVPGTAPTYTTDYAWADTATMYQAASNWGSYLTGVPATLSTVALGAGGQALQAPMSSSASGINGFTSYLPFARLRLAMGALATDSIYNVMVRGIAVYGTESDVADAQPGLGIVTIAGCAINISGGVSVSGSTFAAIPVGAQVFGHPNLMGDSGVGGNGSYSGCTIVVGKTKSALTGLDSLTVLPAPTAAITGATLTFALP